MQVGAINSKTNTYVLPSKGQKGDDYKCVDCNEKVILRKGNIRKHHFAHSNLSNCQYFEHPNESQQHKDAKFKFAERLKQKFTILITNNCPYPKCGIGPAVFDMDKYIYNDDDTVILEYRDPNNKYVADIAVINNNKVKTIFEIKHTHETTTNVRPEPWYEITTEQIFENETRIESDNHLDDGLDKNKYYIDCVRKSINRYCFNCKITNENWALKIPMLNKKNGRETMWKQESPCIMCKATQYSPQFIKGPRQLCVMCAGTDYNTLKEMYNKPLFIDD